MTTLLIKLIRIVHLFLVVFLLFGWLLPHSILYIYLFAVPIVILHWQTNQGTCCLTNLESYLEEKPKIEAKKEEQRGKFIKGLFKSVFGKVPPDSVLKAVVYAPLVFGWTYAAIKLLL